MTITRLIKNSPQFIKPEVSLLRTQQPASGLHRDSVETSSHLPPYLRSISILSSHLPFGLPSSFFHTGFSSNVLHAFPVSPKRATRPAKLIPLIKPLQQQVYSAKSTNYEDSHYEVFFTNPLLPPS